ncbi:MAG: hypothetical protein K2H66_05065 [Oscillospiraceae bacterium]|nr:hypothetical protein [Oscillospiraceae bacterium]
MKIFQKLTAFVTALSLVAVNQSVLLNTQAAIPFSLSCANDEIFTTDDSDMTFTVSNAYARNGDDWDIVLMSDTDEVLAKMEYVDYYTFTCHIDIDNSKAGVLSFYAKDTISDIKTPTIDIIIFDEFTEEDIAKMQEVDNAIAELKQTEDYKNADYDGKLELISTLLQELQEKGLVKSYGGPSFDSLKIEFQYHNGKSGVAADLDELYTYTPEPIPTNPTPT